LGSPIAASREALQDAQRSAQSVRDACSSASGTVSAMTGLSLPECDILLPAWQRFANAVSAYFTAFGEASEVLGRKIGSAAESYQNVDTAVATGAANSGANP
jgi:hypothetical protein